MSHKVTSEDNWLVQCLFLASFGAVLFFGISSGWLAAHLGVTQVSANVYSAMMAPAPAAPVLVYETNVRSVDRKAVPRAETGVPNIMVSGMKEGESVTGMQYVTVLPKYLEEVSDIELRLNDVVQAPKESGSATFAINTAPLPEGTHTIVVDVRGVADGADISLQKNLTFKVVPKTEVEKKSTNTETNIADKKPSGRDELQMKSGRLFATTDRINVRSTPNGGIIAQQNAGARATQVAEAAIPEANYDWILVEFPGGLKGYVATDYLQAEADTTVSVPKSSAASAEVAELQVQVAALQKQLADIQTQLQTLLGQ